MKIEENKILQYAKSFMSSYHYDYKVCKIVLKERRKNELSEAFVLPIINGCPYCIVINGYMLCFVDHESRITISNRYSYFNETVEATISFFEGHHINFKRLYVNHIKTDFYLKTWSIDSSDEENFYLEEIKEKQQDLIEIE